jgi:hypothetical protein
MSETGISGVGSADRITKEERMGTLRASTLGLTILLIAALASTAPAQHEIVYETTIDGYYLAAGRDLTVDDEGNAYVIARTIGDANQNNLLIAGLDPSGNEVWTTYIDGDAHDVGLDLVLDGAGHLLVTGWTDSENFPTTPDALDGTLTGFRDVFLMKLSVEDGSILYSTLLGGDYTDEGHGIAVNDAGEIYLVGSTGSTDFPTVDAYQDEPSAPLYIYTDAFITKLTPNGRTILYSTYFGGFKDDIGEDIGLDPDGNIIIAGQTSADDFPLLDPIVPSADDLFVSKLSADGSTLLFSSYFGGEDDDWYGAMTVDSEGHVYLAGATRSVGLPTTPGAFQSEFVGEINGCQTFFPVTYYNCEDGFVAKLATDGGGLVYGTYLGGTTVDFIRDVAVDAEGNALVTGYTVSSDFPGSDATSAALFLSKLGPNGAELVYTVAIESGSANAGHGVAVDAAGSGYFTGAINVPADVYVAKVSGGALTGVDDVLASGYRLHQNTPNPFNPATSIAFELPAPAEVSLCVYNASGRLIRTLAESEPRHVGRHAVTWDGRDDLGRPAASGVYFYRLDAAGQVLTEQMVMLK